MAIVAGTAQLKDLCQLDTLRATTHIRVDDPTSLSITSTWTMGFRDHFLSDEKVPSVPPPSYPETPVGSTSAPPAQQRPGQFGTPFACLLLSRSDRIRILGFPDNVIPAIDESIQRVWVPGIQNKGPSAHQAYEWKLSGRPCKLICFHITLGMLHRAKYT